MLSAEPSAGGGTSILHVRWVVGVHVGEQPWRLLCGASFPQPVLHSDTTVWSGLVRELAHNPMGADRLVEELSTSRRGGRVRKRLWVGMRVWVWVWVIGG